MSTLIMDAQTEMILTATAAFLSAGMLTAAIIFIKGLVAEYNA